MKLISCHIENFGNLSKVDMAFNPALTSFCEHNGYGKTTLSAFLKAMFYGMRSTTARDKELGERAHFYPFTGGKFGGNVSFEKGGTQYRIERFFDKKSATGDEFALFKGATKVSANPEDGANLIGIDEQSFFKTVFVNATDTECGATGDISRMLNAFVDDTDYDAAKEILTEQKKSYKADRGGGGKIGEVKDEISRLSSIVSNKQTICDQLAGRYEEEKIIKGEIEELSQKANQIRNKKLLLQNWETYEAMLGEIEDEREELNAIKSQYPQGMPTVDEIRRIKCNLEGLNTVIIQEASAQLSPEKREALAQLKERFLNGVPVAEQIDEVNGLLTSAIALEAQIASGEASQREGEHKFPFGIPDEREMENCKEKLVALRESKPAEASATSNRNKKLLLAVMVSAYICICIGAGAFFMSVAIGATFLGLGLLLLIASAFLFFYGKINNVDNIASTQEYDQHENEIRSFLVKFGYCSDGGVEVDFNNLTRDLEQYKQLTSERENSERAIAQLRERAQNAKSKVDDFLEKYGLNEGSPQANLRQLSELTAQYGALNAEKFDAEQKIAICKRQSEQYRMELDAVLAKYEVQDRQRIAEYAARCERDVQETEWRIKRLQDKENSAHNFKIQKNLGERPEINSADAESDEEIERRLEKKRAYLGYLINQIKDDEHSVESFDGDKERLAAAREREQSYTKKHKLLEATLAILEEAEINLHDRYIKPVRDKFVYYGELLEKTLGEKVIIDKDFKVFFERSGEQRSDAHLSAGQKSLCSLCLRLALIDNMYKDEKPFIIMDDPFVHLDAEHLDRAQTLVEELAKNKQIIYFCCHESRKM